MSRHQTNQPFAYWPALLIVPNILLALNMISFSKFSKPADIDFIRDLFSIVFDIENFDGIFQSYAVFAEDFSSERIPEKMETISRDTLKLKDNTRLGLKHPNSEYQIGIDLPIFLEGAKSNGNVFIVAEDPLRREQHPNIVLGVPFGIHIKKNRDGRLKVYWEIIENIVQMKKNVYVTDIYKYWIKKEHEKKVRFNNAIIGDFQSALIYEINTFKPEVIIALGKQAELALGQMDLPDSIKTLSFPHPSGSANKEWKRIFENSKNVNSTSCNNENKIDYLNKAINKYFAQQGV